LSGRAALTISETRLAAMLRRHWGTTGGYGTRTWGGIMNAKKRTPGPPRAQATAKVEAVARASFEHKKSVTEVIPPDVTRAKAGRWLDLISPMTEWAGLRGDALRYQRTQLRIQQEVALEHLAESMRHKMSGRRVEHPLPPKILVPALEAASLESPASPLIDWWADLLVSGATRDPVPPYLVEVMQKIGSREAAFLERLWRGYCTQQQEYIEEPRLVRLDVYVKIRTFLSSVLEDINKLPSDERKAGVSTEPSLPYRLRKKLEDARIGYDRLAERAQKWIEEGDRVGVPLRLVFANVDGRSYFTAASKILEDEEAAIDICSALKLLDKYVNSTREQKLWFECGSYETSIDVEILQFTAVGIEFMKACRPTG
jgi:hypothetical protein